MDAEIDDLKLTELLHDVEMPLALVLSEMERRGIRLDGGALGDLSREMAEEIAELQSAIYADAGHEFNVNSPKQLGTVLFDELGLQAGRKTKTGYSTASGVLEGLVDANPIAARVLEYRELSKLKSTYIDTLPDLAHPTTGRLHTTFNQAGTATGRLSSANPNLQNIPIRTARGSRDSAGVRGGAGGLDAAGDRLLADRPAGAGAHQRGRGDVPGLRERARHPRGHRRKPA